MVVLSWKERTFYSPRLADRNSWACAGKFQNENYLALKVHKFFNISLFKALCLERSVTKGILTTRVNYKHTSILFFYYHVDLLTFWREKKFKKNYSLFALLTSVTVLENVKNWALVDKMNQQKIVLSKPKLPLSRKNKSKWKTFQYVWLWQGRKCIHLSRMNQKKI